NDQTPWYQMEVFSLTNASVGNNDGSWYRGYQGVSRTNTAIRAIEAVTVDQYPLKTQRLAEMRFLRGWIHYKMKQRWKWIPYIDEHASSDDITQISNHPDEMQNDIPIWQKILEDLQFAAEHLPEVQQQVGRVNKFAAKAYMARTLLWMAYPQDETHQVLSIAQGKLQEALVQRSEEHTSELQ